MWFGSHFTVTVTRRLLLLSSRVSSLVINLLTFCINGIIIIIIIIIFIKGAQLAKAVFSGALKK